MTSQTHEQSAKLVLDVLHRGLYNRILANSDTRANCAGLGETDNGEDYGVMF